MHAGNPRGEFWRLMKVNSCYGAALLHSLVCHSFTRQPTSGLNPLCVPKGLPATIIQIQYVNAGSPLAVRNLKIILYSYYFILFYQGILRFITGEGTLVTTQPSYHTISQIISVNKSVFVMAKGTSFT